MKKFILLTLFVLISQDVLGLPRTDLSSAHPPDLNGDLSFVFYDSLAREEIDVNIILNPHIPRRNINIINIDGRPVLHYLSERGHVEALRAWLSYSGIHLDTKDSFGNTALHYAAWKNSDSQVMNFLLSKGADTTIPNNNGEIALHLAAKNKGNSAGAIKTLLSARADPKQRTETGENLLHYMAKYNQTPKAFRVLLSIEPKLMDKDDQGNNPLHHWMKESNGNLAVLRVLLLFTPSLLIEDWINERNDSLETALHLGVKNTRHPITVETVKLLKSAGADFDARDGKGNTPLHGIVQNKHQTLSVISALLAAGANPKAVNKRGQNYLHLAAMHNESIEVIEFLKKTGVDPQARDFEGNSYLHLAAGYNKNPEVLKAFLFFGEGLTARNDQGATPLHLAVSLNKSEKVIGFLRAQRANFDLQDNKHRNSLHSVSKANEHFLRDFLTTYHGLGLNTPDINGDTAFHHAIRKKFRPKILSAFITAGADLSAENKQGETPRDLLRDLFKDTNGLSSKHLQLEPCFRVFKQL